MEATQNSKDVLQYIEVAEPSPQKSESKDAFAELERAIHAALETYSNVHRGNGHFSMATTHLFEQARKIILEYLGLNTDNHVVVFCSPRSAELLKAQIKPGSFQLLSSLDFGLSLGVRALVIRKNALPKRVPFHTGGGTARLMSKDWIVWAAAPDRFEAGTPAIINIIAFARALRTIQHSGKDSFRNTTAEKLTAAEIIYQDELDKFSGRELLEELRKTLVGRGVQVPTTKGIRPFINLDNSASTPTFTPVWNAFRQTLQQSEQVKKEVVQVVKSVCAKTLGAPLTDYEVIFTSNTTEAINLAAESLSRELDEATEPVVLGTLLEHSSNDLPWRMVPNTSIIRLSVDSEGFVDLNELKTLLTNYNKKNAYGKKRIKLVAISGASNVLGICNKLEEISRIVHHFGAQLLVDAAQLVAHQKIDMEGCGIDYLAFSAHKVYAPFGSGALVVRKGLLKFNPGELTQIQASGEENAAGIAALGKSLVLLQRIGMDLIHQEEQALTARALLGMAPIANLEIYGVKHPESPGFTRKLGVIVFALKNKMATQVGKELASWGGIGVRSGCHCAHITVKHILQVGPGLEKFQKLIVTLFPKLSLPGVVRVSLGIENTNEDVDTLLRILAEIAEKSQSASKQEAKQQMDDFVKAVAERVYS
ncbi:MAG: aminotransferase class V-fold PLP-dependent enzyme [Prolixibacteraceae bacterium]|nr:aminotransferase class V-fold PLP-dependent enzyme [Prolixibacteraceae bacterium]